MPNNDLTADWELIKGNISATSNNVVVPDMSEYKYIMVNDSNADNNLVYANTILPTHLWKNGLKASAFNYTGAGGWVTYVDNTHINTYAQTSGIIYLYGHK